MKLKNSVIVMCLTLSAAFGGAVDWNRPELPAEDLKAIRVISPNAVLVGLPPLVKDVPLRALKFHPQAYVGQTVNTEAVLENACPSYFKPCFVLQSGRGTRSLVTIEVDAWLPLHVLPGSARPKVMSDLIGKKLSVNGKLVSVGSTAAIPGRQAYRFKVFLHKVIAR